MTTNSWAQRLAGNDSDLDEVDRLIRNYNSKYFSISDEEWKHPDTHLELSDLANNVTKAATSHALKGGKHLWSIARDYSKRSNSHKEMAQQLEHGTQQKLF